MIIINENLLVLLKALVTKRFFVKMDELKMSDSLKGFSCYT